MPAQKEIGVSSKIIGIDGAPSATQIASVGAGRPVQRSQDTVSGGTNSDTSKGGSQNVQITGTARQLADLDQKVRDLPDVNEERVSQLRTAIEQGTYQVRPQHIADQLMSLERALGSLPGADESDTSGK
jgi:negative regulator of flagellin synthesis FlgM